MFVRIFRIEFFRPEILALLLEPVRQTLEKKQTEDEALVVRRVDGAAQNVGGGPDVTLKLIARQLTG